MKENDNYRLIYTKGFEYRRDCEMCRTSIPYDAKICRYCNSHQVTILTENDLRIYEYKKTIHNEHVKNNTGAIIFGIILLIVGVPMLFSEMFIPSIFISILGLGSLIIGIKGEL